MNVGEMDWRSWQADRACLVQLTHAVERSQGELIRKIRDQLYAKMLDRYGSTAMKGL